LAASLTDTGVHGDDIDYLTGLLDFPYPDEIRSVFADPPGPAFSPAAAASFPPAAQCALCRD